MDMEPVALDIETVPNLDLVDCLPEVEAPANYKNTEAIEKFKAEARAKQIEGMALNPLYGRVCSCAIYGEHDQSFITMTDICDADEINIVSWAIAQFTRGKTIVTWKGRQFDLPYLYMRAMILGIETSGIRLLKELSKKYDSTPFHCDLSDVLSNFDSAKYISLDTAARCILGESKTKTDVTKFAEMIEQKRQNEISIYNLRDSELTYKLYKKARGYYV